jgi:hypothetical protein
MKIGKFTRNAMSGTDTLKVFRPVQTLLFRFKKLGTDPRMIVEDYTLLTAKLSATLQDSLTGSQVTLIPFVRIADLGDIATMHEGHVNMSETYMVVPVILNPIAALKVSNDKYLELEISALSDKYDVEVFGFENGTLSDLVCSYQKFSVPAGTSRQMFTVGNNDVVSFPVGGFDSVRFTFASGVVSELTVTELEYMMSKANDLTLVRRGWHGLVSTGGHDLLNEPYDPTADPTGVIDLIPSYGKSFVLDLNGVKAFEVIRDTMELDGHSYEFLVADLS